MSAELDDNLLSGTTVAALVETAGSATVSGSNNWLQTGTSTTGLTGSVLGTNPGFASAATDDFVPVATSACVGAANDTVTGVPTAEYYENEVVTRMYRVRASAKDIGAFEHDTMGPGIGPYGSDGGIVAPNDAGTSKQGDSGTVASPDGGPVTAGDGGGESPDASAAATVDGGKGFQRELGRVRVPHRHREQRRRRGGVDPRAGGPRLAKATLGHRRRAHVARSRAQQKARRSLLEGVGDPPGAAPQGKERGRRACRQPESHRDGDQPDVTGRGFAPETAHARDQNRAERRPRRCRTRESRPRRGALRPSDRRQGRGGDRNRGSPPRAAHAPGSTARALPASAISATRRSTRSQTPPCRVPDRLARPALTHAEEARAGRRRDADRERGGVELVIGHEHEQVIDGSHVTLREPGPEADERRLGHAARPCRRSRSCGGPPSEAEQRGETEDEGPRGAQRRIQADVGGRFVPGERRHGQRKCGHGVWCCWQERSQ